MKQEKENKKPMIVKESIAPYRTSKTSNSRLTITINTTLKKEIQQYANETKQSISEFVTDIVKKAMRPTKANKIEILSAKKNTEEMIKRFCGAWKGNTTAEETISLIKDSHLSKSEPLNI